MTVRPRPGDQVTVVVTYKYRLGTDTVPGTVIDGRYPDSYLTVDTEKGVLRIPWSEVENVVRFSRGAS